MNRTLEEILNTPVEFREGMRVFSLGDYGFRKITHIGNGVEYPARLLCENILGSTSYTLGGKYHEGRPYRDLLTEQEAYELFPSLKPKVYEYQVVFKYDGKFRMSEPFYESREDFYNYVGGHSEFVELYQPSKRERKS